MDFTEYLFSDRSSRISSSSKHYSLTTNLTANSEINKELVIKQILLFGSNKPTFFAGNCHLSVQEFECNRAASLLVKCLQMIQKAVLCSVLISKKGHMPRRCSEFNTGLFWKPHQTFPPIHFLIEYLIQ